MSDGRGKGGKFLRAFAVLAASLAPATLLSCRDASPTVPDATPIVLPDTALVRVGERRVLVGSAELTPSDVQWSSSDPAVATVSGEGTVTGVTPGAAYVTAVGTGVGGFRDSVAVTVLPVSLSLDPAMVTLLTGQTAQLHALVAGPVDTTVLWRSDSSAVATVSPTGLVTGRRTGDATITAIARADSSVRGFVRVAVNLQLTVAAATITQVTQTLDGSVPLVAGRAGLLRVYVTANLANDLAPPVRVRLYQGSSQVAAWTVASSSAGVPMAGVDDSLAAPWSVVVPASFIQPGTAILVDVDPLGSVVQPNRAQDVFPATSVPLPLDVRTTAPMRVRFVPVLLAGASEAGEVSADNADDFLRDARRMFPIDSVSADVHATYSSGTGTSTTQEAWAQVIGEIQALQVAEGASDLLYYGVLRDEPGRAWCGLGFVGGRTAIGVDACGSLVAAHEWGHNFGRFHAPCGNPLNPDLEYPYPGAQIGAWGYDATSGARFRPTAYLDVMSYCDPEWISDYTYRGILDYRAATEAGDQAATAAAPQGSLLVWGRIAADGTVVLEPAFDIDAPPSPPARTGAYRLTGTSSTGERLFSIAFDGLALGDGPAGSRYFAFALPRTWPAGALARLRLSTPGGAAATASARTAGMDAADASIAAAASLGPGTRGRRQLRWNAAVYPMALVRDPGTGAVLSFARGGVATVDGAGSAIDVTFSDGVRSLRRSIPLTP